jgi:hypothetical protein
MSGGANDSFQPDKRFFPSAATAATAATTAAAAAAAVGREPTGGKIGPQWVPVAAVVASPPPSSCLMGGGYIQTHTYSTSVKVERAYV